MDAIAKLNMSKYFSYDKVKIEARPIIRRILDKKRVNINSVINGKLICIDINHDAVVDLKNIFQKNGFTGNIKDFNEALQIGRIELIWDIHPSRLKGNLGMCLTLTD